jgi:hypothetical protein
VEFLTAGISLAGIGLSLMGTFKQEEIAKEQAAISSKIIQTDLDVNQQKYTMEQLNTQRLQLQNIRNAQQARGRARAIGSASNAGGAGSHSSALGGAYGQISGEEGTNFLNVSENQQIGTAVFGLDQKAGQYKMQLAALGGQMADAQGMSAIGGAISKIASPLGNLFGSVGSLGNLFGGDSSGGSTGNFGGTGGGIGGQY